jgi:hypothetical protein
MTEEARIRDTVMGAYQNANVTPRAERVAEAAVAVRATWAANGLDANTTALQLKPDTDGRYSPNSPLASLLLDNDGRTYRIAAITSAEEIQGATRVSAAQPPASLPKPALDKEEVPATNAPEKLTTPHHPGNSDHPFHSIFKQATAHIERQDEKLGRTPDDKSERLALAATALAANSGITKIDHMVFSVEDKARGIKAGENVIVVQGGLHDPSHDRAHMKTEVAINMPIEQSLKQMDAIHQQQNQQAQTMAMQRTQSANQDSPVQRMSQLG